MNCKWCNRGFDHIESEGVCPSCGGAHTLSKVDIDKINELKLAKEQGKNTINLKHSHTHTHIFPQASYAKYFALLAVFVIVLLATITYFVFDFVKTENEAQTEEFTFDMDALYEEPTMAEDQYLLDIDWSTNTVLGFGSNTSGKVIEIPEGITHISEYAFAKTDIEVVIFPESLKQIGDYAFMDCFNLKEAKLPSNLKAVGEGAFYNSNVEIADVDFGSIPATLAQVGNYGFYNLAVANLPAHIQVGDASFNYSQYYDHADESGFVFIGDVLIKYLGDETHVEIPQGTTLVNSFAFSDNQFVETVSIPQTVHKLGLGAFYYCENLKQVNFEQGLKIIMDSAFEGCSSLTQVQLPDGLETLGAFVFVDCPNLSDIYVPSTVKYIYSDTFEGTPWFKNSYEGTGAFIIGDETLANLYVPYDTQVIEIPQVKNMGTKVLTINDNVKEVIIPDGVQSIGDGAFVMQRLEGALYVTIPDSVTYIGNNVFWGVSDSTDINIRCSADSYACEHAVLWGYNVILTDD